MAANPNIPLIDPQIICGPLHLENKNAFDWSWQGPVAFGCQKFVVVVDPTTAKNLQTLEKHKSNVIHVCWAPQTTHCTLQSPYILRLASVDTACNCIIWDIAQATPISEFSLGNKAVSDIQWMQTNDSGQNLLMVLLAPNVLTVWNSDKGERINRVIFSESVTSFTSNPFQPEQLLLISEEYFIYISDFNPLRNQANAGKKLYMNIPKQKHEWGGSTAGGRNPPPRRLLSGDDATSTDEALSLVDCYQVAFSPAVKHHLLLLFPREILILDTEIMQAVGSIFLDRSHSPFVSMCLCVQRDAMYCLHENGSISFRVRSPVEFPSNTAPLQQEDFRNLVQVSYDTHSHSDPFRVSKLCVPYSLTLCPSTEMKVAVLASDGRVMFWECLFERAGRYDQSNSDGPVWLLSALPSPYTDESQIGEGTEGLILSHNIAPHWFTPFDSSENYFMLTAQLVLTGVYYSLTPNPLTIRMCPPITNKNWKVYKYLVAIGNSGGGVQIFDLGTRQLHREMIIHTCPVRGIEWVGMDKLITYGYPPTNNANQVRNELAITCLKTGQVVMLKKGDSGYSEPITTIRVSPHRNYFMINYKESSPEFWDCRSFKFMRKMDSKPAIFPAAEWASPSAFPSVSKSSSSSTSGTTSPDVLSEDSKTKSDKEVMTVIDTNACIHHFMIEGNKFTVGPVKSVTTLLNHLSAICWKDDLLVLGDIDGTMVTWEVKAKSFKYQNSIHKGPVRKIKFAPGKGNKKYLILYNSCLMLKDFTDEGLSIQMRWSSKEEVSVQEVEWGSSDRPLLLMSDGTIRVYNIKLNEYSSPSPAHFIDHVFNPQCSLPQATFRLKCILQHQPWNAEYSLDHTRLDVMDPIEKALEILLKGIPDNFKNELMTTPLGTPHRSLLMAILFGDEREAKFWTVASYYLLREKYRRQDSFYKVYTKSSYNPKNPTSDIIQPDSSASTSIGSSLKHSLEDLLQNEDVDHPVSPEERIRSISNMIAESNQKTWRLTSPLDLNFDLFMDQDIYQRYQLHRALCHDGHRHSQSQNKRCAESLLLLGQADRAVQLLLETDANNADYYSDALKACLAATIRSSGASQSTIKLVATNLIANSKLIEGVQLLCLIDKGLDACRYLQTYNEWQTSAWLAKSTLGEKEMSEVFVKWVDHLMSCNQKNKALLVMLSLGQFLKVIESLYSMRHFDQAAVFTECCLEFGVITRNKESAPLIEAVFLEYARLLENLGLSRGMRYYCNLAGTKGTKLLEEHFSPSQKATV